MPYPTAKWPENWNGHKTRDVRNCIDQESRDLRTVPDGQLTLQPLVSPLKSKAFEPPGSPAQS